MPLTIRPATAADFDAYRQQKPPYRVIAWTAEQDGRIIGIGGIAFPPGAVPMAWTEFGEEAKALPIALHKTGLRFMQAARQLGLRRMMATTDPDYPAGKRWLERLGFEDLNTIADGRKVFEWRAP